MQSVSSDERIEVLDVARGLAIFGILLVNITFYSTSLHAIVWQVELWPNGWDRATQTVIQTLVEGKFLAIFSFLFGYGMVIFRDRAREKGCRFGPLYARRLLLLMIFGLLHGLFLWFGDILFHYALLGLVLLLFRNSKPRTLLVWSLTLLSLLAVLVLVGGGSEGMLDLDPEFASSIDPWIARDTMVYGSGTYADIQPLRVADWNVSAMNQVVFYPQILGLFLLGAYFARRRLLHVVAARRASLVKLALATGVVGWGMAAFKLAAGAWAGLSPQFAAKVDALVVTIGAPMLGLFYIVALALLSGSPTWRRLLQPVAAVGRTAFTNYIMQSVVCTLIFYGYGLGMYGETGPLANMLLAVGVFAVQLVFSVVWMSRFRMGPLEWLWRAGTYGSVSPLRAPAAAAQPPVAHRR